jgi:hypothetical protein
MTKDELIKCVEDCLQANGLEDFDVTIKDIDPPE